MKHPIPDGDILIHSGDFMNTGMSLLELDIFLTWFKSLPHKVKIVCCGNHDKYLELKDSKAGVLIPQGVKQFFQFEPWTKVPDKSHANIMPHVGAFTVGGIKFYHMPYTLPFMDWGFMRTEKQIERECLRIPDDIDILVSHGPAWGFMDQIDKDGIHLGCKSLLPVLARCTPKFFIHGHIHGSYGVQKFNRKTTIVNCSICNENYEPVNEPIVIKFREVSK